MAMLTDRKPTEVSSGFVPLETGIGADRHIIWVPEGKLQHYNRELNGVVGGSEDVPPEVLDLPSDSVALVIGKGRHTLFVKENKLKEKVEPLAAALNGSNWIEGIDRTICLPEDDVDAWKNAVDFMMTGEFEPRLNPCCDCLDWKDGEEVKTNDAGPKDSVFDPPVQVWNKFGHLHHFRCSDEKMGPWEFPEATAVAFNALVGTFWLADKYLWLELQEACVKRLQAFPIGPEAFMAIAAFPESSDKQDWDNFNGPKQQLSDLVGEAYRYHITAYDDMKVHYGRYFGPYADGRPQQYKCLNSFMRQNMTEEAWDIFTRLNTSRAESLSGIRAHMDAGYWSCDDERQGVCIIDWNEFKAVDTTVGNKDRIHWSQITSAAADDTDVVDSTAVSGPDAPLDIQNHQSDPRDKEAIAQAAHHQSIELSWYGEKFSQLKKTYTFAEAKPGDVLTNIEPTKDPKPGYFAQVVRTKETGWFPRQAIRLLERRPKKDCTCGSCH